MINCKGFVMLMLACLAFALDSVAKDVKDTLYSSAGDRVIVGYSINNSGGQVTVKFNSVLKKLGQRSQEKYKKLDEVAVVIFDRTGNYAEVKFDGLATNAFMVPANVNYTPSADGYFLLQDCPMLQFSVRQGEEANLSIPLYLAHYEKKRHYKVFGQCGTLQLACNSGGKKVEGGGRMAEGGVTETTITSEELTDEGISPADEAAIRMSSITSMLERATKLPFPEELTHEVAMLRELRFKVTDAGVSKQISAVLDAYDSKKQMLETQAEADQQAEKAARERQAQEAQARTDSITAATAEQASKDKKDMMWLIGGIAGLGILLLVGKQVYQTLKNNSMQKMQQQMQKQLMENAFKAQQAAMPDGVLSKLPNEVNQEINREARRAVSKEAQMAQQRLKGMKKGGQPTPEVKKGAQTAAASPTPGVEKRKPSLNDAIPAKYKRWRKPGQSPNNNVTI